MNVFRVAIRTLSTSLPSTPREAIDKVCSYMHVLELFLGAQVL
jgi:hypothetical protein